MAFLDVLHAYFDAERSFSLFFITPVGAALLLGAAYVWQSQTGGFRWGMLIPLVLFGLLLLAVGLGVGLRTPGQIDGLVAAYEASPAAFLADEVPRMAQVNRNWPIFLGTWIVLIVVGLGLRFGLRADWAHGLGPVLVLVGGLGVVIDTLSERRAAPYTAALEQLGAELEYP